MRQLRPPQGGTPPPDTAELPAGTTLFLAPLAHEIARRYFEEFPDDVDRYGDTGFAWCVHDTQYLLSWLAQDARHGGGIFESQLVWLADLVAARAYPVERLERHLELVGEVLEAEPAGDAAALVERARGAKARLRGRRDGGERRSRA